MNPLLKTLLENQKDFMKFLKTRYKVIHQSNLFFRDIHYGVMGFLEMNGKRYSYAGAEMVARELIAELERGTILKKMDERTWLLNYPEFKLTVAKPAAAAPKSPAAAPKPPAPAVPATPAPPPAPATPAA